jgi:hypothetical protein
MARDPAKSKPLFFSVMSGKKKQKQKSPKVKRIEPKVKPGDVSMKGSFKDKWSATKTVYKRPR